MDKYHVGEHVQLIDTGEIGIIEVIWNDPYPHGYDVVTESGIYRAGVKQHNLRKTRNLGIDLVMEDD